LYHIGVQDACLPRVSRWGALFESFFPLQNPILKIKQLTHNFNIVQKKVVWKNFK
jgi:hypothetical protein